MIALMRTIRLCGFCLVTVALYGQQAAPTDPSLTRGRTLLAPGHKVYVDQIKDNKVNESARQALQEWGRWTVVGAREEADIVLRLREVGHDAWRDQVSWGAKALEALIVDAKDDTQLWISKKQTGHRTIFHGYSSPFKRALVGLVEQMKEASNAWPVN